MNSSHKLDKKAIKSRISALKKRIASNSFTTAYPAEDIDELRKLDSNTQKHIGTFIKNHEKIAIKTCKAVLNSQIRNFDSQIVLKSTLMALLSMNSDAAVQTIINAIQRSNLPMIGILLETIGSIDCECSHKIFVQLLDQRKSIFRTDLIHAIASSSLKEKIVLLLEALDTSNTIERKLIKQHLKDKKDPLIAEYLLNKILSFRESALDDAISILVSNDKDKAFRKFIDYFGSDNEKKQKIAIKGFGCLNSPISKQFLLKSLKSKNTALIAIPLIPAAFQQGSFEILLSLLQNPDMDIQICALLALKTVNNSNVIIAKPSILRSVEVTVAGFFSSTDYELRIAALEVLRSIVTDPDKLLSYLKSFSNDQNRLVKWEIISTCEVLGKRAIPLLREFLSIPDIYLRAKTARVLVNIDPVNSFPILRGMLDDPDYTVRSEVLSCLESIPLKETTSAVESLVNDKDRDIRCQALRILLRKGKRITISNRLPVITENSEFGQEFALSKVSDSFLLHTFELCHYCGPDRIKFDYQGGRFQGYYFSTTIANKNSIMINAFRINPETNKFELDEFIDLENAVGRIIHSFDFNTKNDNIKSSLIIKDMSKVINNSGVCNIYVPASVKASSLEMAIHGKKEGHVTLMKSLYFNPYERVRLLLEEFGNNGHAAAAIKGRLFIVAMEAEEKVFDNTLDMSSKLEFYYPLVLDCLAWYCYHYYLTREIPGELELDSFRSVMFKLRELN
ncbi:MAG: HEAT repeat domain-containing protein, partial [Candidatus Hodarchaeales archaeon]